MPISNWLLEGDKTIDVVDNLEFLFDKTELDSVTNKGYLSVSCGDIQVLGYVNKILSVVVNYFKKKTYFHWVFWHSRCILCLKLMHQV